MSESTAVLHTPDDTPSLVSLPHPLRPDGKDISYAPFLPGETLGAYIQRTGVQISRGPVHVWHNGRPVPDALWTRLIPRDGDLVVIRARLEGGGGGRKILRAVALVALVIVTYGVGAWAGLGASLASATGVSVGLANAAILIGGSLLISPLIPEIPQ